jgi:hypothetical protein
MSGNQQPQGQQNPLSAFSPISTAFSSTPPAFGNTSQSSSAANASGSNTAPKPPLFGGSGFSLPQTQSQGTQQAASSGSGGIFGSSSGSNLLTPNTNATPSSGQSGNGFVSSSASSGGGLFSSSSNTHTNNVNPLFGGAMKQPSTPSTQPNPLFGGSNAPVVPSPSGGLFGSQTNNQAPSTSSANKGHTSTGDGRQMIPFVWRSSFTYFLQRLLQRHPLGRHPSFQTFLRNLRAVQHRVHPPASRDFRVLPPQRIIAKRQGKRINMVCPSHVL